MAEKILAFEPEYFLDSEDAIAAYLEQANKEGDPQMFRIALGTVARARGMAALATQIDVTREGLYKALSATGNPSFELISRLTGALGVSMHFEVKKPVPRKKPAVAKRAARPAQRPGKTKGGSTRATRRVAA